MIWTDPKSADDIRKALRGHLLGMLEDSCRRVSGPADGLREVAEAVAAYCAAEMQGPSIDTDFLLLLLCRSLCGVGREDLVADLLTELESDRVFTARVRTIIRHLDCPPDLWPLCLSGLIQPANWLSCRGANFWLLDLAVLNAQEKQQPLDLVLYSCLRKLLDQLSVLWDATGGRGVLGLVAGRSSCARRGGANPELLAFCRALLHQMAGERGWSATPDVLPVCGPVRPAGRSRRG